MSRFGLGFTASGGIQPSDIANLIFWYRADQGVTKDGSNLVSQWDDLSGNGHHLEQASGSLQPTWNASTANGQPAIRGGLAANVHLMASWAYSQPVHVFHIVKQHGWTNPRYLYNLRGSTSVTCGVYQRGGSPAVRMHAGSEVAQTDGPAVGGSFGLLQHYFSGSSSFAQLNNNTPATGNAGTSSPTGLTIFANGTSSGTNSDTECAEMFAYGGEITGDNLAALKAYVYSRYGITP